MMMRNEQSPLRVFAAVCVIGTAAGCGSDLPTTQPRAAIQTPDPWRQDLTLARFEDRNPDPRVVEVNLEAAMGEWELSPGRRVHAMTYNGGVPGPTLEANVGDIVVVHFTNRLSVPTTVHWHGVRVPADMDGSPHSQAPVAPGGSFEYRFTVLDAGTFWYHPHLTESVQMERGLYGAIVVRGPSEPRADAEGVLLLDDVLLGVDGQIAPTGDLLEQHNGREGPLLLVNGRAGASLPIRAGQRQRWRIVNAGSARFYRLSLPGHRFTIVGSDGGLIPTPRSVDELLLVPGDRVDVLVDGVAQPGSAVTMQNLPYARGHGAGITSPEDVLIVRYVADSPVEVLAPPSSGPRIDRLPVEGVTAREVTFNEHIDRDLERVVFTINDRSYPDVPDIETHVGATEVWDLVNGSEMEHPFHLHGFSFQVLSRNGTSEADLSWEDTVQLRGHERLRIAFRPDNRPGHWMYHCHILEHVDNGMMATLRVLP